MTTSEDRSSRVRLIDNIQDARGGYDDQSLDQLRAAVKSDPILPDSVTLGGKNIGLTDALKNSPEFASSFVRNLRLEAYKHPEKDTFTKQIGLLEELRERQSGESRPSRLSAAGPNDDIKTNVNVSAAFKAATEANEAKGLITAAPRGTLEAVEQQVSGGIGMNPSLSIMSMRGVRG